jgi:NAD-dependent SIR2 family protein deacetylase
MECSSDFDRYYEELSTLFNEGNVIGFIGAGVSVNAGLPNWSSLIKECLTKGASSNVRKNLSTFSEQLDSFLKKRILKAASLVTSSVSGDIKS